MGLSPKHHLPPPWPGLSQAAYLIIYTRVANLLPTLRLKGPGSQKAVQPPTSHKMESWRTVHSVVASLN